MTFSTDFDAARLREAFSLFPSGVSALCAMKDDAPIGLVASTFTSVALDPPLVSVCIAHRSTTWPLLRQHGRIGVSVLAAEQGLVARMLAAGGADRFAGVAWQASPYGAVFILGSALWLECSVYAEVPAGDHNVVLLEVQGIDMYADVPPLVFHRSGFRRLEELATDE